MPNQTNPQHDPVRDQPKPEESRRDWENVQTNAYDKTERLRIVGGWLYRTGSADGSAMACVFVPESHA
jgi:hypothetical protein